MVRVLTEVRKGFAHAHAHSEMLELISEHKLSTWGFPKLGIPFWGPHNKDYNILESTWGPSLRESTT